MEKIRVGIAGLGRIGWYQHFESLRAHPQFELAAVTDTEESRREEARQASGCQTYPDYERMLAQGRLDAVVVATPTHLHKEMAITALRQGLHVLLEKPMAGDYAEASAIARAAVRYRRKLTVYQPARLEPAFQHMLHVVRSGKIGQVTRAQVARLNYARRNDWQSLQRYNGGMLMNYGAHTVDQLMQIIGYDINEVYCHRQLIASLGDADDTATIILGTSAGVIGEADLSHAAVLKPYNFVVRGTCGTVELLSSENGMQVHTCCFDPRKLARKQINRRLASAERRYPYDDIALKDETVAVDEKYGLDVYDNFASAIRKGRRLLVEPEETLAVMRVLEQCRKAKLHRPGKINRKK